jgi:hypothetical protein
VEKKLMVFKQGKTDRGAQVDHLVELAKRPLQKGLSKV